MLITIIVDDRTIYCDGVRLHMPNLDWSKFNGNPLTPWDDVRAIQFDTDAGRGNVEYRTIRTSQVSRPDITPPNWAITRADFDECFGWVLPAYQAEAERIKSEAVTAAAAAESSEDQGPAIVSETAALRQRISEVEAALSRLYAESKKVMEG